MFFQPSDGRLVRYDSLVSKQLDINVRPKKGIYVKDEKITFDVNPVEGAGFYVWRIDGYGQRAMETKTPQLDLIFKEKSNISKDPVEVGLAGAPAIVSFKIFVSAYDNHYYNTLLGEGASQFSAAGK